VQDLRDLITTDDFDCWTLRKKTSRIKGLTPQEFFWQNYNGEPPRHIWLKCRNEKCVNPHHMEAALTLFRCGHAAAPSNRIHRKRTDRSHCLECWRHRKCKRCDRVIADDNLYVTKDGREYCNWCRRVGQAVKSCKVHDHSIPEPFVLDYRGRAHCYQCWYSKQCPNGHFIDEENVILFGGHKRYCRICHEERYPAHCANGHDFNDPANVYLDSKGGRHCKPCELAKKKQDWWDNHEARKARRRERYAQMPDEIKEYYRKKERRRRKSKSLAKLRAEAEPPGAKAVRAPDAIAE
jgi:hypothetical protein